MKKGKKDPSALQKAKRTVKLTTVALAVGGIIGTAVGLLNAPKKGKEMREDLEKEAAHIWKQLNRKKKDVEGVVKKTLGEVSPQTLAMYTKAKSEILARVAKQRNSMTKQKYDAIVDSVMKRISKSKEMQKPLANLGKEFKHTWKEISQIIKKM